MAPKEVDGTNVRYECEDGHSIDTVVKAYAELSPIPHRVCPACAQESRISLMALTDFEHIGEAWHDVKQRYYYTCLKCASEYCETVHMVSGNKNRGRRSKDIGLTPVVVEKDALDKVKDSLIRTPPKVKA